MSCTKQKIPVGYRQHSPNAHIPVCGTKLTKLPLRQFSPWQQCTIIMVIFCTIDLLLIQWTQRVQAGREHRALLPEAHCLELGCSQEKGKIRVWNCSEKQIPLLDFPFLAKCFQTATQQRLSPAAEATSSHRAWHLHTCNVCPRRVRHPKPGQKQSWHQDRNLWASAYILFFGCTSWLLSPFFQQSSS